MTIEEIKTAVTEAGQILKDPAIAFAQKSEVLGKIERALKGLENL